jgi:hypothetical protein
MIQYLRVNAFASISMSLWSMKKLLVLVLSIMILKVYHQTVLQVASIPSSFWKMFVEIISEREACKVVIKQEIPDID